MKRLTLVTFLVLLLAGTAPTADAQVTLKVGPRFGYDVGDFGEPFIGADARFSFIALPFTINATYDYYFVEDTGSIENNFSMLSAKALFSLPGVVFNPYFGAGPTVAFASSRTSESYFGITAVGGAEFSLGLITPFVEFGYTGLFDTPAEASNPVNVKGGLLIGF
ncbi:hypothetical protein [Salisaeta longa]|uniref:hypothetical protein n=1 Tax=Salisaeta longa TaxID=503170 RepID=UPI0003B662E6|nr:hypothetical protein [Salisaeta longa]